MKVNFKLAKNEKFVKKYDCFQAKVKNSFSKRKEASVSLTSRRLVFTKMEKGGLGNISFTNNEILVKDIKTINTSYEKDIPLLRIVLMILTGIFCFALGAKFNGSTIMYSCFGIGLLLVGVSIYSFLTAPIIGVLVIELDGSKDSGLAVRRPQLRNKVSYYLMANKSFINMQKEIGALLLNIVDGNLDEVLESPVAMENKMTSTITEDNFETSSSSSDDDDDIPLL